MLLACPCCAGAAERHGNGLEHWIACEHCGCQTMSHDTADKAAAAWNRRPGPGDDDRRRLALAAAHSAAEAAAELMRYAREGAWLDGPFHPDVEPLEKLAEKQSTALTVFLSSPTVIGSIDRLIGDRGACAVRLVAVLDGGAREVEVALKGPRAVSRSVASAIKSMSGVIDVTFA